MRSRRRDYDGSCTLRPGKENKRNQISPTGVYREEGINNMGQHLRTRQRRLLRRRVLRAAQFVTQTSHDVSPFAFELAVRTNGLSCRDSFVNLQDCAC